MAQVCVFTLYQWRPQRGWLMISLLYFCHTSSLDVTSLIHTGHRMVLFSWLSKVCVLTNRSRNPLMKYWGSVHKACCVSSIHFPFNVGCCTCIHSHDSIGLQAYPMDKPVRGICLLLSNQDFKKARANHMEFADREGTDKDYKALVILFKKLGFDVILETDLTAQVRDFRWRQQQFSCHHKLCKQEWLLFFKVFAAGSTMCVKSRIVDVILFIAY